MKFIKNVFLLRGVETIRYFVIGTVCNVEYYNSMHSITYTLTRYQNKHLNISLILSFELQIINILKYGTDVNKLKPFILQN